MAKRRRQYIVDRSFQFKYTLLIAGVGGIISAIFGRWMWEAHRTNTEYLAMNPLIEADEALKAELVSLDQNLLWIYLFITFLMVAALGLLGVLVTHRVAGPAFVMTRYLGVIAEGAYPSLRPLRKKDELKGFFTSLERAVEYLRDRDRSEADVIETAIGELESAGAGSETVGRLKEIVERKRQSIAGATTVDEDE